MTPTLSPAARARLLAEARAYRLDDHGVVSLLDALGETSTADYADRKRAADRRRMSANREAAGVTRRNPSPSLVSHQPQTKTAPDVACDYAEGLTTSAEGGRSNG